VGTAALAGVALGWWAVAAIAMACLIVCLLRRDRGIVASCAVVLLVVALGAARADGAAPTMTLPVVSYPASGRVVEAPVRTGRSQRFAVEALAGDEPPAAATTRICVVANALPEVRLGDTLRLFGEINPASDLAAGQRAFLAGKGCAASMFAASMQVLGSDPSTARTLDELRARIGGVLSEAAPGDAGVMLTGLVTGDDAGFSPARENAFIRTGTTHLTAVSGANLALVAGILATIGAATIGRHRLPWQLITVAGVWIYALLAGAQAPAIRAAIVASAAVIAFRVGRRPDFPTLILLAAGAMALLEPGQVGALGFRLSVAASLALAVVLPGMIEGEHMPALPAAIAATAAAQVATLPFLLPVFGALSLVSLPANLLVAPLVAVAMPLAALAGLAGLAWAPLGEVIAAPATLIATVMIGAVDALSATGGYVLVGIPPHGAATAIALTACLVLLIFSGDAERGLQRSMRSRGRQRVALEAQGEATSLAFSPPRVFTREEPAHALGADADHAVEHPTGEKDGHQVADVGQSGEAVSRELVRQRPAHDLHEPPSDDDSDEQDQRELLAAFAHEDDVVPAKKVAEGG
jgi:competence protein ComEC